MIFFVVLHYVEYIDDFMDRGATMRSVFTTYYPSYVPEIVRLTSPLAIFMSCVYLNGKLAQQLQLAALQTSGVSLYRLLRPYVFVGVAVTIAMFWFNGWVVPQTNRTVLDFEQKYLKDSARQVDVNDVHRQNMPGSVVSVGYFDRSTNVGHRASLQNFGENHRLEARIDAQRVEWVDSLSIWRFRRAIVRKFDEQGFESRREMSVLDTTLTLLPRDFARTERDVESMTIPVARDFVSSLRRSGAGNLGQTLVLYYSKFAYPFANLILVLLGVPLAAVRRRGGQAVQIGLGLLVAFTYLSLMKIIEPFGYSGDMSPIVAAVSAHAVFLTVALVYLARVRK